MRQHLPDESANQTPLTKRLLTNQPTTIYEENLFLESLSKMDRQSDTVACFSEAVYASGFFLFVQLLGVGFCANP